MKGKFYNIQASLRSEETGQLNTGVFTYVRSKAPAKKNISVRSNKTPIRFFWRSSIPQKWHRLTQKEFVHLKTSDGMSRNTLAFLEETQKYIHHIRKPMHLIVHEPEDKEEKKQLRYALPSSFSGLSVFGVEGTTENEQRRSRTNDFSLEKILTSLKKSKRQKRRAMNSKSHSASVLPMIENRATKCS